jgi:hypothetical protein
VPRPAPTAKGGLNGGDVVKIARNAGEKIPSIMGALGSRDFGGKGGAKGGDVVNIARNAGEEIPSLR